jgi:pimeloyl-ACP methyl ester carboxylesterase
MLELIDKGSCGDTHPTPLLFVHGGWHAAWCWDEHFLDFFADNGYRALALSRRGHGGSSASKPIRTISIADYVEDVVTVAEGLPTPPVVIGHSMGGFVVQKYLETHQAPAGVLLASIPPEGIGPTARAYGTEAEVFPDMGHNMMLEPGWASVAERIHSWMTSQGI